MIIAKILEDLPSSKTVALPTLTSLSRRFQHGILLTIKCAGAIEVMAASKHTTTDIQGTLQLLKDAFTDINSLELFAFGAAYQLVLVVFDNDKTVEHCLCSLKQILVKAIIQLDAQKDRNAPGLTKKYRAALQSLLAANGARRRSSDISIDTGYGSMSDDG